MFSSENSTNVANYYTAGLKGRWQEGRRRDDHQLTASTGVVDAVVHGRLTEVEAPTLLVLNQDLRTEYISDCGIMHPVFEPGKIASWVAPPSTGINGQSFEYEYVHLQ